MLRAQFFAALLLLGVLRVEAQTAVCGSAATGTLALAATYVCTCPTGTGLITAVAAGTSFTGTGVTATLSYGTSNTGSVTTVTITGGAGGTGVATAAALAGVCDDLMPGYSLAIGATVTPFTITSIVTACTTGYCAGFAGAFAGQALPTGVTGTLANLVLASSTVFPGTFTVAAGVATVLTCPANTASNTGFTSCTLNAGYYQTTAITAANVIAATTVCLQNYYCPGGGNAATVTGSTACPNTGTVGTGSGTAAAAATNTALSNCQIGAGYYVSTYTSSTSATVAVCAANSYCPGYAVTGTNSVQATYVVSGAGVGAVACPYVTVQGDASSNSAAAANVAITFCALDMGYYQTAGAAATTTALATATVAVCLSNYYCPGSVGTGAAALPIVTSVTNSIYGASACPYATTVGDATYTQYPGTSSNAITDCFTKPGYFIVTAASSAGSGALCTLNEYCPGGYPVPGTVVPSVYTIGGTATTGNDGAVSCPAGSTLAAAVAATAATANNGITDCVIPTGFYVSVKQGTPAAVTTAVNVPGTLAACPAGSYCAGGAWSDVVGYGFTSILPNYVVTAVTSGVPSFLPCGTTALVASCTAAKVPWSLCTGNQAGSDSNYLLGASCSGASSSNLLTVGYGATVTNTDYYVSAAGTVSSCLVLGLGFTCTLGQSLTTAGGASIPSGYYVSAVSGTPSAPTLQSCPTGATCAGASYANVLTIGYGVTINSGYYLSSAGVVTICPTGATCAGASVLTVGTGFAVSSGYVISAVATGVATVIACPTGAVCSGGSKIVTGTGAVTASGYYTSVASAAGAIATLTACATTDVCVAGLSLAVGASPATPIVQAIIAGSSTVSDNYYQISGTNASTAVYAVCPTGATCAYTGLPNSLCTANTVPYAGCTGVGAGTIAAITGNAGVLGSNAVTLTSGYYVPSVATVAACPTGATCAANQQLATVGGASANAGYYVSAVGVISACPTGAICGPVTPSNAAQCTAAGSPYSWCTAVGAGTPAAFSTPVSTTPGGINIVYPGFMTTSTYLGNAIAVSACPTGSVCLGDLNTNAGIDLPYSGASTASGYYVSAVGTVTACPAGASCTAGVALTAPGGGSVAAGFYIATAGSAPALCPSGSYCPGGGNLGLAGGSFACPVNSTLTGCNDFADNAPSTVNSSPVSVAPAPVTVTPAPITVTPAPITVTTAPITVTPASQPISINVPAPVVSAASSRSSALVLVLAALAALAAF